MNKSYFLKIYKLIFNVVLIIIQEKRNNQMIILVNVDDKKIYFSIMMNALLVRTFRLYLRILV